MDCFAALAMKVDGCKAVIPAAVIVRLVRNCALGRTIQHSRDGSDRTDKPRRTGYPAFAAYDRRWAARPMRITHYPSRNSSYPFAATSSHLARYAGALPL
jgi:hypothetical protein